MLQPSLLLLPAIPLSRAFVCSLTDRRLAIDRTPDILSTQGHTRVGRLMGSGAKRWKHIFYSKYMNQERVDSRLPGFAKKSLYIFIYSWTRYFFFFFFHVKSFLVVFACLLLFCGVFIVFTNSLSLFLQTRTFLASKNVLPSDFGVGWKLFRFFFILDDVFFQFQEDWLIEAFTSGPDPGFLPPAGVWKLLATDSNSL